MTMTKSVARTMKNMIALKAHKILGELMNGRHIPDTSMQCKWSIIKSEVVSK